MFKRPAQRIEDLYRKREKDADGIHLTDAEFFAMLRDDDVSFHQVGPAVRKKQWEQAAIHLLEHYRERRQPVLFFDPNSRDDLVSAVTRNKAAATAVMEWAEHICNHTFYSPYIGTTSMGPYIDWYSDLRGNSWFSEHVYALKHKIFSDRLHEQMALGAPEATWEFNKHEHLVELGKAYWMSDDERFSCEFVIQLVDWIEKNPCMVGINWVDELTVAQRAINWVWALQFFKVSEHVSANFLVRCLKSLALHGAYLRQYLQLQGESRPLYRMAAACALYLIAHYLSEFQFSKPWATFANEAMIRATLDEFDPDGGCRAASLDHQRVALELGLVHYVLATLNGESVDSLPTRGRLLDAMRFLSELASPGGAFQPVGAGCPTRCLPFGTPFVSDPRGALAVGSLLFGRKDHKHLLGDTLPWPAVWLMGQAAIDRFAQFEAEPPADTCRSFPHTGFHMLREGWGPKDFWLLFRSGGSQAVSGPTTVHDDRFHISLGVGGETIFTDLGTSTMVPSPGWFDQPRTHNVLSVRHARPLQHEPGPDSTLRNNGRTWVTGEPRYYQVDRHMAQPATEGDGLIQYRRELLVDLGGKWLILRDVLLGSGEVEVDSLFYHLPGLDMVQRGDQGCVLWKRGAWMRIQPYFPANFRWNWDRPREKGQPPFFGADGVRLQPAQALRYYSRVTLPCEIYFWINWDSSSAGSPEAEEVKRLFAALPTRLQV